MKTTPTKDERLAMTTLLDQLDAALLAEDIDKALVITQQLIDLNKRIEERLRMEREVR